MISSIVPHSPSTITTSSIRIGCVIAICSPAMMVESDFCAANPAMTPATPAEAKKPGADLANLFKVHQNSGDRDDQNDEDEQPSNHLDAGFHPPLLVVVVVQHFRPGSHHRLHGEHCPNEQQSVGDDAGDGDYFVAGILNRTR